jgi:hypothetical protein
MVEWNGTVVLTTPRLLLRTFRRDDIAESAQECHAREGLGLPRTPG